MWWLLIGFFALLQAVVFVLSTGLISVGTTIVHLGFYLNQFVVGSSLDVVDIFVRGEDIATHLIFIRQASTVGVVAVLCFFACTPVLNVGRATVNVASALWHASPRVPSMVARVLPLAADGARIMASGVKLLSAMVYGEDLPSKVLSLDCQVPLKISTNQTPAEPEAANPPCLALVRYIPSFSSHAVKPDVDILAPTVCEESTSASVYNFTSPQLVSYGGDRPSKVRSVGYDGPMEISAGDMMKELEAESPCLALVVYVPPISSLLTRPSCDLPRQVIPSTVLQFSTALCDFLTRRAAPCLIPRSLTTASLGIIYINTSSFVNVPQVTAHDCNVSASAVLEEPEPMIVPHSLSCPILPSAAERSGESWVVRTSLSLPSSILTGFSAHAGSTRAVCWAVSDSAVPEDSAPVAMPKCQSSPSVLSASELPGDGIAGPSVVPVSPTLPQWAVLLGVSARAGSTGISWADDEGDMTFSIAEDVPSAAPAPGVDAIGAANEREGDALSSPVDSPPPEPSGSRPSPPQRKRKRNPSAQLSGASAQRAPSRPKTAAQPTPSGSGASPSTANADPSSSAAVEDGTGKKKKARRGHRGGKRLSGNERKQKKLRQAAEAMAAAEAEEAALAA